MRLAPFPLAALVLALAALSSPAAADPLVFRGVLDDGTQTADGRYALRLTLYADAQATSPLAGPLELLDVPVSQGRFAAPADFGALPPWLSEAWLEVAVKDAGDYAVLACRRPVQLKGVACPTAWSLQGNAATDPALHFLGTTDAAAFEIRTRNSRSLRIEPSTVLFDGAPVTANLIAGSVANTVDPGVRGATIAGGGLPTGDSDPLQGDEGPNRAVGDYGSVGGGFDNVAGRWSTVAGGINNDASHDAATVGGGAANRAAATLATVGGGTTNLADGQYSVVAGGRDNQTSGLQSAVGGGRYNVASGEGASIGGGLENEAGLYSAVGGGRFNLAHGNSATVAGGVANEASGNHAAIGGGVGNLALGGWAAIPGGNDNCAGADYSFAGGRGAKVRPGTSPGVGPCGGITYPGGGGDVGSFVWADASGGAYASTGPNQFNVRAAGGVHFAPSTRVFFGQDARQGLNLFGEGYGIGVQSGTTYFRSGARFAFFEDGEHSDTALDPGAGGALLMTINASDPQLPQGVVRAQSFVPVSDRSAKTGFAPIDARDVLARVLALPISEWSYRTDPGVRHVGPMAQDFHAAFGLNGDDDKSIPTVDADGVALAAIQGLHEVLSARLDRLEAENARLRAALAAEGVRP